MACLYMKAPLFALLLVALSRSALPDEPSYHAEITAARSRYLALANRKATGGSLSTSEEKERLCLLGQLIDQDPVLALTRDIMADAQALEEGPDKPEVRADVEKLRQLALIPTGSE